MMVAAAADRAQMPATRGGPSVFLADTDAAVSATLREVLSPLAILLRDFPTGASLLEGLILHRPVCVITELELPDLSGLVLLRQVQERRPGMPVLLISRTADVAAAVDAMRGGAVDFLEKGAMEHAVLRHVRRMIREPQIPGKPAA